MIILQLKGGLGNQMFQYAFGRALSIHYNQEMFIDKSTFDHSDRNYSLDFFVNKTYPAGDISSININDYSIINIQERRFGFDDGVMEALDKQNLEKTLIIVSGYWQSYGYFQSIEPIIRNDFKMVFPLNNYYKNLERSIFSEESVMVHIRRGDYLLYGNPEKHGTVGVDYIEKAINYYRQKLTKPKFFIFSDEIQWCEENIPMDTDMLFVKEDSDEGKTSFYLMCQCKYFVIANSTFSWWAAWLGNHHHKFVISPKNWFKDETIEALRLIPGDWNQI